MNKYLTPADIQMRLHGSIVRYMGSPVSVTVIPGTTEVSIQDLISGEIRRIEAEDQDLNVSAPPLGYYYNPSAPSISYLSRLPLRRMKEGIDISHLSCVALDGTEQHIAFDHRCLGRTILGDYPSFEEARDAVLKGRGAPFGRRVAIATLEGIPLFFIRGQAVGYYAPESNTVRLQKSYKSSAIVRTCEQWVTVDA